VAEGMKMHRGAAFSVMAMPALFGMVVLGADEVVYKKILDGGPDPEYAAKAEFEMAKCLFYLKQYDSCIKGFTAIAQKFPKHPELKDALFFVGRSYEEKGDKSKAGSLYKKIISMGPEDDPVVRKVRKALRSMEGEKA
jgi:TolA-binding protein